ncbi:amylo-alpha-1,6-glucosidase [Actinoallomurus acanthiterrae]
MGPRLIGDETALWAAAARVLDANWTGAATVPSPGLYPHQWSWDSAFTGIGLAHHRPDRAETELLSLFRGQWATGLVPHIVFSSTEPRRAYFPGPELWLSAEQPAAPRGVDTSGLTQPPLQALTALHVVRAAGGADRSFLTPLYPCLVAQHAYLARDRDIGGSGLVSLCHPWESGLDDSPAWDPPLAAVDSRGAAYAGGDHDRYVALVAGMRAAGYRAEYLRDDHPFVIEDPLFNAVYLASTHALAELADLVGADPRPYREAAERIHDALLERLWDESAGCFRARDLRTGRLIEETTVAGFAPLLDPELPEEIVRSLADLLLSAHFAGAAGYPVPTCDIQSEAFDRGAYWRGPTWVNTNWLLWAGARAHGLGTVADLLFGSTVRLVRQSGFREYFDPFDGSGRGSHDFSWSAALVLDLLTARRAP